MIIEVRKLKIKSSSASLKKVPFDVLYLIDVKHKEHVPKFLRSCLAIKPDQQLRDDLNSLELRHVEVHGMRRKEERKHVFPVTGSTTVPTFSQKFNGVLDSDMLLVPILTRTVKGKAYPYYLVNRRVQAHLTEKQEKMNQYNHQLGITRNEKVISSVELQVAGNLATPCALCPNGLLKSMKWNHCSLGSRTCIDTLLMAKSETFAAKSKAGKLPSDYQEEGANTGEGGNDDGGNDDGAEVRSMA